MDDKRFDDIIREKAEGYHDTGHDAQALQGFRRRMDSLRERKNAPGFGKSGYLLGAIALFTLINFGIVWYFSEGRHIALNQEIGQLREERSQLISNRNATERTLVDTVYIYQNLPAVSGFQSPSLQTRPEIDNIDIDAAKGLGQYYTMLSSDQHLSQELQAFLSDNNLLLKGDNGELILLVSSKPVHPVKYYHADRNSYSRGAPRYLSEVQTYEQREIPEKPEKTRIPNQLLWALEKHNHHGIDFQFGVEGIYHKSNFDVGEGDRNGSLGLMTEVIFSPAWRLETGLHFGTRSYKISEEEIATLPPAFFEDYPGYDDQLGELNSLESEAQLIKVPFNLKRFAPLDHNKRWYISAGLTPQWSRSQEFEYKYSLQLPPPPNDGEFVSFVGAQQEVAGGYYTTTVNLGLGTEIYLDEKLRWQLGIFYQKGIGDAGYENRQLQSSFGVKSSLWFNKP